MDDNEAVQLLESIFNDNTYGEGEDDNSQRPDVDTPQEGGGEDSGVGTTTTSFEAESQEARNDLEEGYSTLQLLEQLIDDGRRTFRSHFRRSADTEVPPLPHRPMGQGRHMCGWADTNGSTSPPHRPAAHAHRPTAPTPHRKGKKGKSASVGARRSWRPMWRTSSRRAAFPINGIDAALSRAR